MTIAIGKSFKFLWYALQGCIIALCVIIGGAFALGRLGYIQPFSAYVILSGSMSPAIPVGSVIITQKQLNYTTGDVVTFIQDKGKTAVTHRIAATTLEDTYYGDATFTTKGDANKTLDQGTVSSSSVAGKVLFNIPYLGYAIDFAKTPKGFLAFVIIPATIIIYEELKSVGKEIRSAFQRIAVRFKKKKEEASSDNPPSPGATSVPKGVAFVPVIAAICLFTASAGAYFYDSELSLSNILGAATSYGEKTASLFNSDPFTCATGATNTGGPSLGFSVMKIVGASVSVDAKVIGGLPNATYDIWVNQDPGGCPLGSPTAPGVLLTDGSGTGIAHVETPLVGGATNFWISVVSGSQVLRSIAVTLP